MASRIVVIGMLGAVAVGLVLQFWLAGLVPTWTGLAIALVLAPVIGLAVGVAVDLVLRALRVGKSS